MTQLFSAFEINVRNRNPVPVASYPFHLQGPCDELASGPFSFYQGGDFELVTDRVLVPFFGADRDDVRGVSSQASATWVPSHHPSHSQ